MGTWRSEDYPRTQHQGFGARPSSFRKTRTQKPFIDLCTKPLNRGTWALDPNVMGTLGEVGEFLVAGVWICRFAPCPQ